MAVDDVLEKLWKLRTDPFYPEVGRDGAPLRKEAFESSLNPLIDERVGPLYFDVYDWSSSALLCGLTAEGDIQVFPDSRTLRGNSALMVIVSGAMETGLDSLVNLILHKIHQKSKQPPIVVDVSLDGRDKARNVLSVARRIVAKFRLEAAAIPGGAEAASQMATEYERIRKEEEGRPDAAYSDLFQTFRDLLQPIARPIVVKIVEGGDNDSWVRIYEAAKSCCSSIIVMTADSLYAKTCYNAMIGRNVAWIKAVALNEKRCAEFLAKRLAAERLVDRLAPLDEQLWPFTLAAIKELYRPGSAGAGDGELRHPVGWLRRTLYKAFRDHALAIGARYPRLSPAELAPVDPATITIGASEMSQVRAKMNAGGAAP